MPAPVHRVAAGRPVRAVWRNELGGLAFEVGAGDDRCFAKWAPAGTALDLAAEAERMAWLGGAGHAVPRVLDQGADAAGSWLVTTPLPGTSAVADPWLARPAAAVAAIGRGLRRLHDGVPTTACPFSWSAADRVATAHRRVATGEAEPAHWHEDHRHLSPGAALAVLDDPPTVDRLVVCHGDACAPNTLVAEDGAFVGHVDLGTVGVADRWADLAVATWSTVWNYGPGWEPTLLDAYGIDPDPERTSWYRLLWDLS